MELKLPEGLPMPDGMSKPELLELLLTQEYGFPPEPPLSVHAEEIETDAAGAKAELCGGEAVLKHIRLTCRMANGDFSFPLISVFPAKIETPVPCFLLIGFGAALPDTLPLQEIVGRGYGLLYFCYTDITPDDGDFSAGLAGLVFPEGRTEGRQCGKLGLWAWAASRAADYALTLPFADPARLSLVGHSRLGKTVLLAGALDERFHCVFANDSGTSGAALFRGNRCETLQRIRQAFPWWFCKRFAASDAGEEALPFDQHFLLAANAPHRVYVASAQDDPWADPVNEYLSCAAADGYFRQNALPGLVHPDRVPLPGETFHKGWIGHHLRAGGHDLRREDWLCFMDYLENQT